MDDGLTVAIARVREVFARYPRRAVLDGCPHCRGPVTVDEHDLFSLSIRLGNTVGDRHDVKSLLPVLFERLVTATELDPGIVLGKLRREEWRTWPATEQSAVDGYLEAVWRSLLAEYPARLGSFLDASTFLGAASSAGESIDRFLAVWEATQGPAADRHLAEAVGEMARGSGARTPWLRRGAVRDRLCRAFERDHEESWADDLARAYDLLLP
ncbi:hypothetical protein [Micromonospora sp. NPDC047074]|uniref:hypothetical protein n=1 Tax=Micromonospora sp. NPDC047074 TaxID=3154339 RepID=UPI00340FAB42